MIANCLPIIFEIATEQHKYLNSKQSQYTHIIN